MLHIYDLLHIGGKPFSLQCGARRFHVPFSRCTWLFEPSTLHYILVHAPHEIGGVSSCLKVGETPVPDVVDVVWGPVAPGHVVQSLGGVDGEHQAERCG